MVPKSAYSPKTVMVLEAHTRRTVDKGLYDL